MFKASKVPIFCFVFGVITVISYCKILLHEDEEFEYYKVAIDQEHPSIKKKLDEFEERWPGHELYYAIDGGIGSASKPKSSRCDNYDFWQYLDFLKRTRVLTFPPWISLMYI